MMPTSMDQSDTPPTPYRRDGFALPIAILMLTLVTVGLIASFGMASDETASINGQRDQARAFGLAQTGLESFIARRNESTTGASGPVYFCPNCAALNGLGGGILPTKQETVTVALTGGSAFIKATPVQLNRTKGTGTYLITSTGIDSLSVYYVNGSTKRYAKRTVGVFATYSKTQINVLAGWTSLSGIDVNGQNVISGIDACGSGNNVAGLTVPYQKAGRVADLSQSDPNWRPLGSPAYDTLKSFDSISKEMKMDWATVKTGTSPAADITIPPDAFPTAGEFAADAEWFPVIHVKNLDWVLPNRGQGTLIVDGDLTINGSNQWDGVILVGGKITSDGDNVSSGATISGLNYLISGAPPRSSTNAPPKSDDATANGQKTYVYNSCNVSKATNSSARYYVMANTWMDNLAGY